MHRIKKNDANDAKACAEAVVRADMRFVGIKTDEQIEMQQLLRIREIYVKRRTGIMNSIRGLLSEFGIAIPQGQSALIEKLQALLDEDSQILLVQIKKGIFQ